jgi:hypothetical protein
VQLDPQQENRRLRASAEKMRSKQRFAVGGITAGGFVIAAKFQFAEWLSPSVGIALIACGVVIPCLAAIPFLRSACPKCKGRYHSNAIASILRRADNPAPCKSCGFDIDKHIPRYG